MGLIAGYIVYKIGRASVRLETQVRRASDEEEQVLLNASLVGLATTVLWPVAAAIPLAARKNPWSPLPLAIGLVYALFSIGDYLAIGLVFGLLWGFVFCWWINNPQHVSPMTAWYFTDYAPSRYNTQVPRRGAPTLRKRKKDK